MYNIKEMARKTGLPAPTLRFYEKEGILPFVKRDEHGNRLYDENDLEWLDFILALRATGMPLRDIKQYVDLYQEGDGTFAARRQMMMNHKLQIEEQIANLYKYLDKINYKLALYDILKSEAPKHEIKI